MKERIEKLKAEILPIVFRLQDPMLDLYPVESTVMEKLVGAISACNSALRDLSDAERNYKLFEH